MKRTLAALSLVLVAAGVMTACAPTDGDDEERIVRTVSEGSIIPVADLVPDDAKRFTIVCPYESVEDVATRLGVPAKTVPDLSKRDDAQALIVVTADGVDAAEFPRDRVDLCSTEGAWAVYERTDTATAAVARKDDVYVVTR
ncbi:hypothetical protein SAMN05216488_2401 [Microbacterium sp. LKL04]|uniref:hypothetical protein n=1 Tax=Microbacterium sp. LKL04 TaxID=912630 RepID=UPI000875E3EA|nr:hypothetical protein [Microbacterium sp. LKL04]SCY58136.1 hypothetical protein SAMN05216488_2401 [Microbacterium sp. LKL04]